MSDRTAIILVHGSWHGSWCWGLVEPHLNHLGFLTISIDLPGHGLNARPPSSFVERPLDAGKFSSEVSHLSSIPIDSYSASVISGADRAISLGADRIVLVGHSMGGVPITFACCGSLAKFSSLVYVAALCPTPDRPAGYYLSLEDQQTNGSVRSLLLSDPADIGALRIDSRSVDDEYNSSMKSALASDVDDGLLSAVCHLLTPDAPAAMYGEVANFPDGFGSLKRTYIRCTNDRTVLSSTSDAIVSDMNASFPDNEMSMIDIVSSHEPMFSVPDVLAKAIADSV